MFEEKIFQMGTAPSSSSSLGRRAHVPPQRVQGDVTVRWPPARLEMLALWSGEGRKRRGTKKRRSGDIAGRYQPSPKNVPPAIRWMSWGESLRSRPPLPFLFLLRGDFAHGRGSRERSAGAAPRRCLLAACSRVCLPYGRVSRQKGGRNDMFRA